MERVAKTFYDHYVSLKYYVKVIKIVGLKNDILTFGKDEYSLSSVDFIDMSKFQRLKFYIKAIITIRRFKIKNNITHTISFGDLSNVYNSLSFSSDYKVASIHALKSVEFKDRSIWNRIFKICYKSSYKYLDKVVCISKDIKEDLINKCGFKFVEKLKIIYNPHNLEEIIQRSKEPISTKSEKQIFEKKTILFLGRFSEQKAPWHLLNAFSILAKKECNSNLVFIGDGDKKIFSYLKDQIRDYHLEDRVFFLGRKENPYKYLINSDVLVLSSHYEGTPNVIVESIGLNVPVVSSFCTKGITELMSVKNIEQVNSNMFVEAGIVTPNLFKGELGLPKNGDICQEELFLADAILNVLKDSEKIREVNKKVLLEKFNLQIVATEYLK